MLNTRGMTKAKYKGSSIEELKAEYEKLIKEKCYFETKEEQMKHDISIAAYGSSNLYYDTNSNTFFMIDEYDRTMANELLELIKEKSGETYKVETKTFNYSLDELIDYIADKSIDPFWNMSLKNFFKKLDNNKDYGMEKLRFLLALANNLNRKVFDDFSKELTGEYNAEELFQKYSARTNWEG